MKQTGGTKNTTNISLDIQTPGEDRRLNPQTSPEVWVFMGSKYRSSPGMTGGFWMIRI